MEFSATTNENITLNIEGEQIALDRKELRQNWLAGRDILEVEINGRKVLLKVRNKGGPFGPFEPLFGFYEFPAPLPRVRARAIPSAEKDETKVREVTPPAPGPVKVRKTSGEEPFVAEQVSEEFEKAVPRTIRIRGSQGESWEIKPSAWRVKIQEAAP